MTRKRFEKRLMGLGASRNEAHQISKALPYGWSYQQWFTYCSFKQSLCSVGKVLKQVATAIAQFVSTAFNSKH